MAIDKELNVIVATDCGSTTTKAILIEKKPEGYRQTFRGEAPTTVEAPFEDVTKGVLNSVQELEAKAQPEPFGGSGGRGEQAGMKRPSEPQANLKKEDK